MSNQGGSKANNNQQRQQSKGCVGEPDVIVVVGGKEFNEHSKHLCFWSEYFDAALLRSGMKESISKRVEFPDEDPQEWELIKDILSPCSEKKITKENLKTIVHWSNKLLIPTLLDKCDKFLLENVLGKVLDYLPLTLPGRTIDDCPDRFDYDYDDEDEDVDDGGRDLDKVLEYSQGKGSGNYHFCPREVTSFIHSRSSENYC